MEVSSRAKLVKPSDGSAIDDESDLDPMNSPLYVLTANIDKEIELQYRIHSALDIIDEKCSALSNKNPDQRDLFLGLLYATESYKIYGYMTNTKIKFILVVDSLNSAFRENEIRTIFRNIHQEYVNFISNPFIVPNEPIFSKTFDKNIRSKIDCYGAK